MSEPINTTRYKCRTCGHVYDTKASADKCESMPIREDRGVKVGDMVRVTQGDGTGRLVKVERVFITSMDWGHYAWERYWHTVGVDGPVQDSYGHRMLPFDSYEVAKP